MVFSALLPELHFQIGAVNVDSFWVGSILVIVLTGLYVMLGGMRAVAYNDAVQVCVLLLGSGLLTAYGLAKLGGWGKLKEIDPDFSSRFWPPQPWRRSWLAPRRAAAAITSPAQRPRLWTRFRGVKPSQASAPSPAITALPGRRAR